MSLAILSLFYIVCYAIGTVYIPLFRNKPGGVQFFARIGLGAVSLVSMVAIIKTSEQTIFLGAPLLAVPISWWNFKFKSNHPEKFGFFPTFKDGQLKEGGLQV